LTGKKIGVLLAGGASRRFGEPKAFSLYKNVPMYQWALQAINPHVDDVVVVSHPILVNRFMQETPLSVIEDDASFRGMGPLAGIYSAMKKSSADWYYVIPCDTPLVTSAVYDFLARRLEDSRNGIVPTVGGRLQPLISIYHRNICPVIKELLNQKKLKMTELIDRTHIDQVELKDKFPEKWFVNVNTKKDLRTLD